MSIVLSKLQVDNVLELAGVEDARVSGEFHPLFDQETCLAVQVDNYREAFKIAGGLVRGLGPTGTQLVHSVGVIEDSYGAVTLYWTGVTLEGS